MPIPSPNPDGLPIFQPTTTPPYGHPAEKRRGFIPMAFQITSPFDRTLALLPHALVLHINPSTFGEVHLKKIERFQTRGGYVEQHWGEELSEISAEGSTGAFVNFLTGVTSALRQQTIAWDRYRDLHDLFLNNGSVRDPYGSIVLQGQVMIMYDRGTYLGTFRTFEVEETEETPFAFRLNWNFKVEETILKIPGVSRQSEVRVSAGGVMDTGRVNPNFQTQNRQVRVPSTARVGR